jgi:rhodanese-related sulfurtransferase
MSSSGLRLLALGSAIAMMSCAEPPRGHEAKPAVSAPEVPKKPVRMNGRGKLTSISLSNFYPLNESGKVLLFDARPAFYHAMGHIPAAISMPKANCDAQIVKREKEIKSAIADGKTIVVYCTSITCPDARAVAIHLAGYGYSSSTLTGGWDEWKEAGLPIE